MAEGQVAQAFGGKIQSDAEFKTESGQTVKVFVKPLSLFCGQFEKWVRENSLKWFDVQLATIDGQIVCVCTDKYPEEVKSSEVLKDTVNVLLDVVNRTHTLALEVSRLAERDPVPH